MQETIVTLAPPEITSDTIQERLSCVRPMREGNPNISLEAYGDKKSIVHCYGHGGSGWTMLFGSVNKALSLFFSAKPSKNEPIRIIGGGCMGLLMAVELARQGYRVAGITSKELIDIPSWKAAGYFALVSLKTSPDQVDLVQQIGMDTFLAYQKIHRGEHPYFPKDYVRFLPVYCDQKVDSGVDYLERKGLIPKVENVTLDFGGGVRHKGYLKYMTYFINGSEMMTTLLQEVKRHGIPIEKRKLGSFEEVKENWIFNCSGMGARELSSDDLMIPVKGHLITLKPSAGKEHLNYMIHADVIQDGKVERLYMFPKINSVSPENPSGIACSGVLGGTFIRDNEKNSDELEFNKILERSCRFFYGTPKMKGKL